MRPKIWRISTALCVSLLLVLLPNTLTNGCGSWDEPEPYVFFNPTLIRQPLHFPFLYTPYQELHDSGQIASDVQENIADWQQYFGRKVPAEEIKAAVYETDTLVLWQLQQYALRKSRTPPGELPKLAQWLRKKKKAELIPYLVYARRCQPYAVAEDEWSEPDRDEQAMQALVRQGQQLHATTRSDFLKLRYAYQLVRMAQYAHQYEQSVQLYERLVEPNKANSIIRYWAMANAAGAMLRSPANLRNKAMYLFSIVFDKAPSRKLAAYRGFVRWGGGKCAECLPLARNTREKTTLHLLQGLAWENNALEQMRAIYALYAKSNQLELLLARELQKAEQEVMPVRYQYEPNEAQPNVREGYAGHVQQLRQLTGKIAQEGKALHPALWSFATAYLSYFMGDRAGTDQWLQKAQQQAKVGDPLHSQARLLQLIAETERAPAADAALEAKVHAGLVWLEQDFQKQHLPVESARVYLLLQMALKYGDRQNRVMEDLCVAQVSSDYGVHSIGSVAHIDSLLAFLEMPEKQPLARYLAERYGPTREELIRQQGNLLLGDHRFADAVAKYERVPSAAVEILKADPFYIRIRDCHDCDFDDPVQQNKYTPLSFARRMVELQHLAATEKDRSKAAGYHFLLANGLYNISYYGNTWYLPAYGGRDTNYPSRTEESPVEGGDCSAAQDHYEKTMQLARSREFAAKACFMAAKCEQNRFFNRGYSSEDALHAPDEYRTFFRKLKREYSNTRYYRDIIRECSYFASFVGRK